ncbi:hypothetical protein BC832DRAFT_551148 [Gaertneriomyces semiglobifer]|nr:hypothetical protein BC832DRAFT_551148 [Gaertneriomyces semiglobifer]
MSSNICFDDIAVEFPAVTALRAIRRKDEHFMSGFLESLRTCPFKGYFFETPAVTGALAPNRRFEYVLVDAPSMAQPFTPEKDAFGDHLIKAAQQSAPLATFWNLNRDAKLVAPTQDPSTPETAYSHVATFSRCAPVSQQLALWSEAASVLLDEYKSDRNKTFWLSTSGLRVLWLHLRIDTRPKHIHWTPYMYL